MRNTRRALLTVNSGGYTRQRNHDVFLRCDSMFCLCVDLVAIRSRADSSSQELAFCFTFKEIEARNES